MSYEATMALVAVLLIAMLAIVMTDTEDSPECPTYGEVPALIDGGYECIPWEQMPFVVEQP